MEGLSQGPAGPAGAPGYSRIEQFPLGLFASVMGIGGLAFVWRGAAVLFGFDARWAHLPFALSVLAFVAILAAVVVKAIRFPRRMRQEWGDPVKLNFFAAGTISLMLLGTYLVPLSHGIALALWATGTALHLVLTLTALRRWIDTEAVPMQGLNPTWFMPVVGNLLVPVGGAELGFVELSWFHFSIGAFFWPLLLGLILNRLFFHERLAPAAQPSLFIMISPPAVGYLAYVELTGAPDAFAWFLFYVTVFMLMLLLLMLPRLMRNPFTESWWSFSFPTAAACVCLVEYAALTAGAVARAVAAAGTVLTTLLIAFLVLRTAGAIWRGTIFLRPDPAARASPGGQEAAVADPRVG